MTPGYAIREFPCREILNHVVCFQGSDRELMAFADRGAAEIFLDALRNRRCRYHLLTHPRAYQDACQLFLSATGTEAMAHSHMRSVRGCFLQSPADYWLDRKGQYASCFETDNAMHLGAHLGRLAFSDDLPAARDAKLILGLLDDFTHDGILAHQQHVRDMVNAEEVAIRRYLESIKAADKVMETVDDLKLMEGTWQMSFWKVVSRVQSERKVCEISDGNFKFLNGGNSDVSYKMTIDKTTNPPSFTWTSGNLAWYGRYLLAGDDLKLAYCNDKSWVFTFFESAPHQQVMKRIKK